MCQSDHNKEIEVEQKACEEKGGLFDEVSCGCKCKAEGRLKGHDFSVEEAKCSNLGVFDPTTCECNCAEIDKANFDANLGDKKSIYWAELACPRKGGFSNKGGKCTCKSFSAQPCCTNGACAGVLIDNAKKMCKAGEFKSENGECTCDGKMACPCTDCDGPKSTNSTGAGSSATAGDLEQFLASENVIQRASNLERFDQYQ